MTGEKPLIRVNIEFCDDLTLAVKTAFFRNMIHAVNIKRVIARKLILGIADGTVSLAGKPIYDVKDLRVGLFP